MAIVEWIFINTRGTLWNDRREYDYKSTLLLHLLEEAGKPVTSAEFEGHRDLAIDRFTPALYESILWQIVQPDLDLYEQLKKQFQKKCNSISFDDYRSYFSLNQGALRVIHSLSRSYQLALAEDDTRLTKKLLDSAGLLQQFSFQNLQEKSRFSRPDPRLLSYLLEKTDTSPERVVLLSSSLALDIVPALALGMKTVLFKRGIEARQKPRFPSEIPHIELDSLSKFPDAVKMFEMMAG